MEITKKYPLVVAIPAIPVVAGGSENRGIPLEINLEDRILVAGGDECLAGGAVDDDRRWAAGERGKEDSLESERGSGGHMRREMKNPWRSRRRGDGRRRLSRDIRGNWDPGARLEASSIMVPVTPASEMEVMIGREVDPTRKCWEVGS